MAFSPYDVYVRSKKFDWNEWNSLLDSGEIIFGKLTYSRYGYTSLDSTKYFLALKRVKELNAEENRLLSIIRGLGDRATFSRICAETGYHPNKLRSIIAELEENLYIVRKIQRNRKSVIYKVLDVDLPLNREELLKELIENIKYNFKISDINRFLGKPISLDTKEKYYTENTITKDLPEVLLLYKFDPSLSDFLDEIFEICSEDSNFVILKDADFIGGIKIEDKDEYIEIDTTNEKCASYVKNFIEDIVNFYRKPIIVFNFQPNNINTIKIGEFLYVYGKFDVLEKTYEDLIKLVLSVNYIHPLRRVQSVLELERNLLGLNSNLEVWNRCWSRITLEKYFTSGILYEGLGKESTISYMSLETASLLCSIRSEDVLSENEKTIIKLLEEHGPLTLNEIMELSPLGSLTSLAIKELFTKNRLVRDYRKRHILVSPRLPKSGAEEYLLRKIIDAFGIVSLNRLVRILRNLISKDRVLEILRKFVESGELKIAFIRDREEIFYYKEDILEVEPFEGLIILDPKDIMQKYLGFGRSSWFVIINDGEIVGRFKGLLRNNSITITEKDFPQKISKLIYSFFYSMSITIKD